MALSTPDAEPPLAGGSRAPEPDATSADVTGATDSKTGPEERASEAPDPQAAASPPGKPAAEKPVAEKPVATERSPKKTTARKTTARKTTEPKTTKKKTPAKKTPAKKKAEAKKAITAKTTTKTTAKKPAPAPALKKPVTKATAEPKPPKKKALISKGTPAKLVPYKKEPMPREPKDEAPSRPPKVEASGALTWLSAPSVPQAIRGSFGEAVVFANLMVDRAENHPALSVHEFRKTIRRSRALIRLLRGVIDPDAVRSIDTGLQSAVLPTSGLRDARILLATLDRVPPIKGSKKLRRELRERFEARIKDLESHGEESRVLIGCRAPLARLPGELADALPAVVEVEELRESLRRSYRRARRTCLSAVRAPEDASIHRARKRVKELRYQLEWLLDISAKRNRKRHKRVAALAQDLGDVTDLLVLEEAILDDRMSLRGLSPKRFCQKLRQLLLARFDEVTIDIEKLFDEAGSAFAEGIGAKLEADPDGPRA